MSTRNTQETARPHPLFAGVARILDPRWLDHDIERLRSVVEQLDIAPRRLVRLDVDLGALRACRGLDRGLLAGSCDAKDAGNVCMGSASCGYDCRIVFSIKKHQDQTEYILLIDIGTHDDVY